MMAVHRNREGRPRVKLRVEGASRWFNIHQLVCRSFHGDPPSGKPSVLHWDDDPWNNRVDNLRWGSQSDNHEDRRRNGNKVGPKPEEATGAKLTWETVRDMRTRYANGEPQYQLAKRFGVSRPTVNQVVHGRTWKE